jgi:hypothetical protein
MISRKQVSNSRLVLRLRHWCGPQASHSDRGRLQKRISGSAKISNKIADVGEEVIIKAPKPPEARVNTMSYDNNKNAL